MCPRPEGTAIGVKWTVIDGFESYLWFGLLDCDDSEDALGSGYIAMLSRRVLALIREGHNA